MQGATRIAVVGSGISGLSSAWLLAQKYEVTLFEAGDYLGGHTNTVDVTLDGVSHPVDTGFLVYNTTTYPNLTALLAQLGVASVETEMSFAVSLEEPDLEWSGSSLATVFGQKRNLVRPDFLRMLSDILRFNREAIAWVDTHADDERTLRSFLSEKGYSRSFQEWYLLPMAAAIWSCPAGQMLDYPLVTFVRFCRNHGLLRVLDRPMWRTVRGGAREYVNRLAGLIDEVRLNAPVSALRRVPGGVEVVSPRGTERFDEVVLACHSDQALAILGEEATDDERSVLGAIRYQPNRAVLHSDPALLPRDRSLWAAWNYSSAKGDLDHRPVSVSYLINRLQPLPFKQPVSVTLNPQREPAADKVIAEFNYAHPIFDAPAVAAQRRLATVSGRQRVWFCGAWAGYGFHEDGLKSGLAVANALGCHAPWQGAERAQEVPPLIFGGRTTGALA
ncbi:FAD-dependent oxidoreductase [Rhodocyclus tenuis]|uniref:FAD-dependent oxidoreductase n=2 Tax=Rhodocyclus TaxID=1064 RepID=A0A6L5JZI6_RHOTE|nr:FAD-dependent oxidoreductase [Rhodocyclus gracilis]MQY52727.1 FAD-dependent oxidoreductase [Rhodocyclus gracilis]MRD74111.1 FAD-dependent oxidoreductase [Rhodocyclus gracilis]NJA90185.1 FAD-dependent oxidoreductase [Rhodocyclus gracilis]